MKGKLKTLNALITTTAAAPTIAMSARRVNW
jgi:hypothetical protein